MIILHQMSYEIIQNCGFFQLAIYSYEEFVKFKARRIGQTDRIFLDSL